MTPIAVMSFEQTTAVARMLRRDRVIAEEPTVCAFLLFWETRKQEAVVLNFRSVAARSSGRCRRSIQSGIRSGRAHPEFSALLEQQGLDYTFPCSYGDPLSSVPVALADLQHIHAPVRE